MCKAAVASGRLAAMRAMAGRDLARGRVMTGEQVPTWLLEGGDVIRVCHHHDSQCGECLARWETDAVVTEKPAPVCDRVAVKCAGDARLPGARPAITRVSGVRLGEQALRIGRLAAGHAAAPPAPAARS